MLIKKEAKIKSSDITPKEVYQQRRQFLKTSINAGLGFAASGLLATHAEDVFAGYGLVPLKHVKNTQYSLKDELTQYKDVTTYNNFYEFGASKSSPAATAHKLNPKPWSIKVEGHIEKPATYHLEDLISEQTLEERIYRLRCVERWSMVIPWLGFPLAELIKKVKPTSKAKFIEFSTLYRPDEMQGQRRGVLAWPYVEGLRMDEAMHPLAFLAVGLYGEVLPNQNGAPIRLVVPWKYGFKSIKSIVKIRFTEQQPISSWTRSAPREYGFYSNVNPDVDHPRWSQRRERRIGEFFKRKTLMFNGYADEVAHLYKNMDLKKSF
ncbi:Protein-methionine-sulfoxide reductase catalytic subunit MsrP [hydrothermal vent metagenome]|uniref:Protein-methionine-sulfoxide reductase catalytic subunit MsrP n=1 Tax=hydrothermal vent metagenome TaxID=652676 RepID=A0A3B0ZE66_9ZZZZ